METTMTIRGLPFVVIYEHTTERDPYGTGDSPMAHYIDVMSVYLEDSKYDILELVEHLLEQIEDNILEEVKNA